MGAAALIISQNATVLVNAAELPDNGEILNQGATPNQEENQLQEDGNLEKAWQLLPAENLRWNELGQGIFDNPNNGTIGVEAYVYGPSGTEKSYWGVYSDKTITLDLYHLIRETGTYTFKIVTLTYTDSAWSEASGSFEYVKPDIQLPVPTVKINNDGVVSAALPSGFEYTMGKDYGFDYELYERDSSGAVKRINQIGMNQGTYDPGKYVKEGIDYYVKVKTISRNINKWTDSEFTDFISLSSVEKEWPFDDTPENLGHWKYENIKFVYDRGIMTGVKETEFRPDEPLTRSQFASVIYRMAGEPSVEYKSVFTDVPADKWYSNAIIWAYENNIVAGLGDGCYGLGNNITREQMARMLMEFARVQGYGIDEREDLDRFEDASQVSRWATEYMRWAVGSGMISGSVKDGKYYMNPKGQATRAECATMLTQFIKKHE